MSSIAGSGCERIIPEEAKKTLEEIGKTLGFSKERIRQIENIALKKLKEKHEIVHLKEYLN